MNAKVRERRIIEKFGWDQKALDFIDYYRLDPEVCEAVARYPQIERRDPYSEVVGHLVMNYRRGDIVVTVGFRDPTLPQILHVRLLTRQEKHERGSTGKAGAGGDAGSKHPTSLRELKRRAITMGYKIVSGTRHERIVDPNNGNKQIAVLPRTEGNAGSAKGDRRYQNSWAELIKYHSSREALRVAAERESSD